MVKGVPREKAVSINIRPKTNSFRSIPSDDSLFQLGLDLARLHIDHPYEPDHLAFLPRLFSQGRHLFIALFEPLHVFLFALTFGQSGGDERTGRKGGVPFGKGGVRERRVGQETGEDGQFSGDIRAGEVVPWVGFLRRTTRVCSG